MSDPVVVVGAGAAGLAAAAALRGAGQPVLVLVLEADRRSGGRARTIHPPVLHGAMLDEGATWLHQIDRNPLVDLARAAGDLLHPGHEGGRTLFVDGRVATEAEAAAYAATEDRWRDTADGLAAPLANGPDTSLSAVGDRLDADAPWLSNLEMWEGSIIAAADADQLSLLDWRRNELADPDLRPDAGVGALLCRHLGPAAGPVRCGVPVRGVDWSQPGRVRVDTDRGRIDAAGCIVTVSTGVLRDGRIRFTPALPASHLAALDGLPMGLLSKLALPIDPGARFAVPDGTRLEPRLANRRAPAMVLSLRPDGSELLTGFLGGRHAWSHAGREHESLREARERLGALLGADALRGVGEHGHASRWGSDALFLGAYAYARPGHASARDALGLPFANGLVALAGEAGNTEGLAGTVGGAMKEGARAAAAMLRRLGRPVPGPAP